MFRKTNTSGQFNLFSSAQNTLSARALKVYEDDLKWHNQFRVQVTERIDEELFRPLFCEDFGAPNASIRVLLGMMILKEAQGWSDSQLFEHCLFHTLVRSALGLLNMDDPVPANSTYYILRKRIVDWENKGNDNLMEKVFAQVTKSQAIEFKINGNKIRMDSKLLGSNIAWYSRYELIHETLVKAYKSATFLIDSFLSKSDIELLKQISGESGDKVSYRSNRSEIEDKLTQLGVLIHTIISQIDGNPTDSISTLRLVFEQQYQIVDDVVSARPKEEIKAASIQSPHDTDCHYRKKDDQQVKGYSTNTSETCDKDNKFDLITNVLVEPASAADSDFLQPAIEATQEIVSQKVETVNADGAYHSVDNQDYCKENDINLIVGAIQGKPSQYDLSMDENGKLVVTDLQTDTIVPSRKVESRNEDAQPKWAILTDKKKYRYFTQKEIDTCSLRKQIASRTKEELNVRNNVEVTIFQLGYHYPNNKSRYRGLSKHKIWANARCLWINFVRIAKYNVSQSPISVQNTLKNVQTSPNYAQKVKNYAQKVKTSPNYAQNLKNYAQKFKKCVQKVENWLFASRLMLKLGNLCFTVPPVRIFPRNFSK
jgi:hypothetical protein